MNHKLFLLLALVYFSLGVLTVGHAEDSFIALPTPPKARGPYSPTQACVAPIPEIRRFHGQYLKHQRNDTMHRGIRTSQHSLVACINCHVVPDEQGQFPNVQNTDHFCQSCHSYAAVNLDCFQCHASQPDFPVADLSELKPEVLYTPTTTR